MKASLSGLSTARTALTRPLRELRDEYDGQLTGLVNQDRGVAVDHGHSRSRGPGAVFDAKPAR
jgi:hypothetical protein